MAKATIPRVACDTCFFIALFNNELGRWEICKKIVNDAHDGRIQLVLSCACIAECARPAPALQTIPDGSDPVEAFFDNEYLKKTNLDWFVANRAREIQAQVVPRVLKPYDAVHLATAVLGSVDMLFTYDDKLLNLNGHAALGGLRICKPTRPWDSGQLSIEDV